MSIYRLQVEILTPLHIGTGEELRHRFEYVVHQNKTWRLDVDRILESRYEEWQKLTQRAGKMVTPAQLLREMDFQQHPEFFRYVLAGTPRSEKTYAALRECIKDPWDRPYLPGSSLKGAIRTALAWAGWEEVGISLKEGMFQEWHHGEKRWRPRKHVGDRLERLLFEPRASAKNPHRRSPHLDLLRALQISDLHGPQKAGERLAVLNAQVVTRDGLQAPIPLEAVVGATFEGTLKVDDYLFSRHAQKLGFRDRQHWLTAEFLPRLRRYSQARMEALADRFAFYARHNIPGAADLVTFYQRLLTMRLPDNAVFLTVGWGTGWDGKTFWTHLQRDQELFENLVRQYRLQRRPKGAPLRKPGDVFPSSRRVVVRAGKIAAPFGWVVIMLEEQQ